MLQVSRRDPAPPPEHKTKPGLAAKQKTGFHELGDIMPPTDTLSLRRDRITASVVFHAATALYDCTSLNYDSQGASIVRNWPGLSAGEELLWSVLAWLNDQGELPTPSALEAGLDADNLAAVRKTIERAGLAA